MQTGNGSVSRSLTTNKPFFFLSLCLTESCLSSNLSYCNPSYLYLFHDFPRYLVLKKVSSDLHDIHQFSGNLFKLMNYSVQIRGTSVGVLHLVHKLKCITWESMATLAKNGFYNHEISLRVISGTLINN